MQNKTAKILLGIYLIVFAVCAVNPYSRAVWRAENIPIVLIVLLPNLSDSQNSVHSYSLFS